MLSRKVDAGSVLLNSAAGIDRSRIGERLQAALAGLQELHILKEKQESLVREALEMEPERAKQPPEGSGRGHESYSEEMRLEATLAALKEQLSRLRRQDVGLKSHLHQLDQQISELKLDVSKASTEHLESDSRPSSGFYELSDGGSGSLSNSCTSVYSECMSSSQGSLPPYCQQPASRIGMFEYRPKSADETTVEAASSRQQPLHIRTGSRIRTSADLSGSAAKSRQRPVSAGDLDIMMSGLGCPKIPDMKSVSSLCQGGDIRLASVDPKYQCNLVSRSGNEVYPYPSPLHAVALQSPLFSVTGELSISVNHKSCEELDGFPINMSQKKPNFESSPGGYINRLLYNRSKANFYYDSSYRKADRVEPSITYVKDTPSHAVVGSSESFGPQKAEDDTGLIQGPFKDLKIISMGKLQDNEVKPECLNCLKRVESLKHFEDSRFRSVPPLAEEKDSTPVRQAAKAPEQVPNHQVKSRPEKDMRHTFRESSSVKKSMRKCSSGSACLERRCADILPASEFVHAKFVPAESHQMKVRQAGRKTKAIKLKRKSSDKHRSVKQLPCEKPKDFPEVNRSPAERGPANKHHSGKLIVRQATFGGEETSRSCSESSLFPAHSRHSQQPHRLQPQKVSKPYLSALNGSVEQIKKKQTRKWQSAVEISAKQSAGQFPYGSSTGHAVQQPLRKAGVSRASSMRPRPLNYRNHPSIYCYAMSESEQSEYSAECSSLFHSTIVETSEGEQSDYTANRFGDSESSMSQSEASSDSSLTIDTDGTEENELVWAEAAMGPTAAGISLTKPSHLEPRACRVKASKALKKKIRRFQPAALKVMTMV
ncbi:dapper homolog 2 [Erpetoichthys calabaricus]|uniref:dapper homolog 2 n=1 Tax=Erpetoichthys calabaricus TaxID=27687 RepID=UPI002234499E|nr:dapper homolog 2 [Erpetoichthys calabaricus]